MKKRICFVLLLSLVMAMAMTITVAAYANPIKITNGSDLRHIMENGGEGVLTQDITASDMSSLRVREGCTAAIDMNGYSIAMTCSAVMELRGNVALYNGNKINIYIENGSNSEGVLALNDINVVTIKSRDIVCRNMLLVNIGETRMERMLFNPVVVTDSKNAMTKDQLVDMVNTGKLPQLECEGYVFTEWQDQSGKSITEWKAEDVTEIKSVWEKDIKISFDADGGTCDIETARPMDSGKLKTIPAAKKDGVCFDGWMTEAGKKVTKDTVFKESTTVKAAWVEESERADALADFMNDQGFSQSSIDKHVGMLAKGSTASIFGSGSIWMIVAFIFIVLSAVLGIIAIKRK